MHVTRTHKHRAQSGTLGHVMLGFMSGTWLLGWGAVCAKDVLGKEQDRTWGETVMAII